MGKFNFGIDSASAAEAELGEGFYSGDCPPKGNYHVLIKQAKMNVNSSGDFRIAILHEITEPEDSEKAQYNGYGFFSGLNINDQGKPYVNNFLDVIGAKRKDFWDEKITCSPGKIDKDTKQDVLKIGSRKVTGHVVLVSTKIRPYNGDDQLDVVRYLDDDGEGGTPSSDVEPDDDARGLDEPAASSEEASGEGYSQDELEELEKDELQGICDAWDITYAKTATKATLVKLILKAQEESDAADTDDDANAAQSAMNDDDLTEDDLEGMEKAELIEYMDGKGWDVPKPAIPSRLRKTILQFQAEPPF